MIIKCKMCGGDVRFNPGDTCGQCDHCGCTTTFPKLPDEQRTNLFNRANHFRRQGEFDKAAAAYEHILEADDTDAEAYWGIVLSKFGIEYVEDPATHERIPTCHRVQVISILSDEDYQNALKYAPDTQSREIYEKEAKRIAEIQKGILAISSREKPYDVFICYKETDDSGSRTKDSALAQEIYYQLTNEGYKVFFSRITLEDKLGQAYEPYIFSALNSAKVMLVVGTKPENFSAVWVRNEWSRFLTIMKNDRKRVLIPCYRDMNPYDLPEELSSLQSQDMSRIGFMQDLIHGVKKVLGSDRQSTPNATVQAAGPGIMSLHKRAVLFLEDSDWDSAAEYFDRILDIDPEYAPAYIGKVQVKNRVRREVDLARCRESIAGDTDYQKALRFADEKQKAIYEGYNRAILDRIALERKEAAYREAAALESRAAVESDYLAAAKSFDSAEDIRDARERAASCRMKATAVRVVAEKAAAVYKAQMERERKERERQDEERRAAEAQRQKEETERLRREELLQQQKKKKRATKIGALAAAVVLIIAGGYYLYGNVKQAAQREKIKLEAVAALDSGDLETAYTKFTAAGGYEIMAAQVLVQMANKAMDEKNYAAALSAYQRLEQTDSTKEREYTLAQLCYDEGYFAEAVSAYECLGQYELSLSKLPVARYAWADQLFNEGEYEKAAEQFALLGGMTDSVKREKESRYQLAKQYFKQGNYEKSKVVFRQIQGYQDADIQVIECDYQIAGGLLSENKAQEAQMLFASLGNYSDSETKVQQCIYIQAEQLLENGKYTAAKELYQTISYQDSADKIQLCDYREALAFYNNQQYAEAEQAFLALRDYSDSAEKAKASHLQQGKALMNQGNYEGALSFFETVDYGDSQVLAGRCHYELGHAAHVSGNMDGAVVHYAVALSVPETKEALLSIGKDYMAINEIRKAIQTLWLIRDQEDAKKLLAEIAEVKTLSNEQETGLISYLALGESGTEQGSLLLNNVPYESIENELSEYCLLPESVMFSEEVKYQYGIIAQQAKKYEKAIEVFTALENYSDAPTQIMETQYLKAKNLTSKGEYSRAAKIFTGIKGYKDTDRLLAHNHNLAAWEAQYAIGNYMTFGHYPQTASGNDSTPIEWLVLARDGNKALLISRYGLDVQPYNNEFADTTWENCTLRTWLNDTFLNKAFTAQEQTGILLTNVDNSSSQGYSEWDTSGGNDTQDRIFLLSYTEANRYLGVTFNDSSNMKSRIAPTAYAIEHGADAFSSKTEDGSAVGWWLRSPGQLQDSVMFVSYAGFLNLSCHVVYTDAVVRPALWIDLESGIF